MTLKGCPIIVDGSFCCSNNVYLESLNDGPKFVYKDFYCHNIPQKSLNHLPIIYGNLYCDKKLYNSKEYKQWKLLKALRK